MQPLLTQVIPARNDNYMGNFKYRLETMLNFNCHNVEVTGNIEAFEVLVVDWNSDSPLRHSLNLNDAARRCVSFLEVPPDMARGHMASDSDINVSAAVNVGIRRAKAEMIMTTPADILFPQSAMRTLFPWLRGEVPTPVDIRGCYWGVPRLLIPWQAAERLTAADLSNYLLLHTPFLEYTGNYQVQAAGEAGSLFSRELIGQVQGFNEAMYYRWGQEVELGYRLAQIGPILKTGYAGIFAYDLHQRPGLRGQARSNVYPRDPVPLLANDKNWGLARSDIPRQPATYHPEVDNSPELLEGCNNVFDSRQIYELPRGFPRFWRSLLRQGAGAGLVPELLRRATATPHRKKRDRWALAAFDTMLQKFVTSSKQSRQDGNAWSSAICRNRDFHVQAFENFLQVDQDATLDETALYAYLSVMEAMRRRWVRRFLFSAHLHRDFALLPASLDPSMEITCCQDLVNTTYWLGLWMAPFFHGFFHITTGPVNTAFARTKAMRVIGEPYQCVYLDLDYLHDALSEIGRDLPPLLDGEVTVIIRGSLEDREFFKRVMRENCLTPVAEYAGIAVWER